MKTAVLASVVAVATLCAGPALAGDPPLHNTELYTSPWDGETPSKGTFSVRHEGIGEPPETGHFRKHEPGEVAEFHLFVPDGLDPGARYPLLIVYHGGKDGASGKGMCSNFATISTTRHPVIVLAPNMYTLDAMNELLAEGKLPIDRQRVVVYGHSSGGMGVLAAMAEYGRTGRAFVPTALMSASTTASMGRAEYPPCTYYVMAGEKETPEFVTNEILRERRRDCRVHSLQMQQFFPDVRYVEIEDSGHSGGTPAHKAIIQHALAVSERTEVTLRARGNGSAFDELTDATESGDWPAVHVELTRLDGAVAAADRAAFDRLRTSVLDALETWFRAEAASIAAVTPESSYVVRDRAFSCYDRCRTIGASFADTRV